ncbi:PAS domain S-box-containing protein [Limimaricola soesokkakensis]|uniref:histidine kinase n=1 Tax=Limimaricola soesokkakensis TaxID=1343159 RepID=A0A1X6Z6Y1_9RHOB|nr:HWE histidine kinase domain-containing protein [Limimaricola soesokkakensis]PSK86853.1 PAS domain S-box-containing protein [Limimaricola soesokkakensis]SLN40629.1 Blue-light-activated histidine kinase [Limimaricola soesokkakensis]
MAELAQPRHLDVAAELIEDAPCGIAVTDPDGRLQYINATLSNWLALNARPERPRRRLSELLTLPGRMYYETHMAPMMRLQGYVREISCALEVEGGPPLPVMLSGVARRDAGGSFTRFDYTIFDARERRVYEEELRHAQREADELAAIVRSSPNAILRVDAAGRVRRWNAGATQLFGLDAEAALGRQVDKVIPFEDRPNWFTASVAPGCDGPEILFEAVHGCGRAFEVTLAPIGERGLPGEEDWSVILRDVSRRYAAEQHLRVMVDEMKHRVKNTLGVVSGIARQSLGRDEAAQFVSRLQALSQAHDALTATDGTGAELHDLLDFARREAGGAARLHINGPPVRLGARQATSLSMALHELVTNALKYGALSRAEGHVQVDLDIEDDGRLRLLWREHGGPPVVPPTRRGFGTKMIGLVLKAELGAEVSFDFDPSGFCFQVIFMPG